MNTISLTHSRCDLKITEHPDSIANLERQIVQWTKQQVDLDLYDDFWLQYKVPSQGSTRVTNRSPWFYNVPEKDEDISTITEEGRRLAATYTGDDYIMIDSLGPFDGPSRITMCTENDILTGFQVFYGTYNEIAGSSHGDLSTECINTEINTEVESITIYGS